METTVQIVDQSFLTAATRPHASIATPQGRTLALLMAAVYRGQLTLEMVGPAMEVLLTQCRRYEAEEGSIGAQVVQHVDNLLAKHRKQADGLLGPLLRPYVYGWDSPEMTT